MQKAPWAPRRPAQWDAGLAYTFADNWDLNAGYRYVDTKLNDDNNIKYRGFLVGLSYRFGGHKESGSGTCGRTGGTDGG